MNKGYHTLDSLFYDYDFNILKLETEILVYHNVELLYRGKFKNCPSKYCTCNLEGYMIIGDTFAVFIMGGE